MRAFIVLLLAMSIPTGLAAAQNAGCPEQPTTLAAMRDCYRPLLIFASSSSDGQLAKQLQILSADAPALRERDVRVVVLTPDKAAQFNESEQAKLRTQFKLSPDHFTVLLVGKDGGDKMRRDHPVSIRDLSRKIDSMPMRQQEMKQPPR
jgi:hypothetical protein